MSKKLLVLNQQDALIRKLFSSSFLTSYKISLQEQMEIYKDLAFTQANTSRKAINKAKSIRFVCDDERIIARFESKIFYTDIISQILETYLFGLNVFELNWSYKDNYFYPELIQRDFRDFAFKDNELKFNNNGTLVDIPKGKVVYALYESSAFLPYGDALLPKLYWAVKLKHASTKFWAAFQEKFGSPWVIAKTNANPDELAVETHAMLSGDTAVIDVDEEISLIQPTSTQSDFHNLVNFLDNCIRSVILGGNLSSQVEGGSFAAAETHNAVRQDLANADLNLLLFVINKVLEHFKEINNYQGELYAELEPINDIKSELAQRDSIIYNMGFDFDENYIKETYGVDGVKRDMNLMYANNQSTQTKFTPLQDDCNSVSKAFPNNNIYYDKIDKALNEPNINNSLDDIDNELRNSFISLLKKHGTLEEAYEDFIKNHDLVYSQQLEQMLLNGMFSGLLEGANID